MGLGKAVVQRQTRVEEAASLSLWLSLFISILLYGLLWIIAPWLSEVYDNSEVTGAIRLAGLYLPLSALASIPTALLQRNMEFRRLFWVQSSFLVTQGVISVCLALAGIGFWSMILGQLAGMSISVGFAWGLVRWRPRFVLDRVMGRSIVGFSFWIMVSGMQTWLLLYADNAIAGMFMGVHGLGVYSLGFNIATLIPGFFIAAVGDVAYPIFCRLQESPKIVGNNLLKLQMLTAAILFPVAFGISAIAQPVITMLYGDSWPGLGSIIGFLVIMPGLSSIWTLNGKAYQAIGRPDVWTKLSGFALVVLLPLLWIAGPYGLSTFALARFGGAMLVPLANMVVATRILGTSVREQIEAFASPFCISVIMFALVSETIRLIGPFEGGTGWAKLFSIITIGALVYLFLTRQTNRRLWDQLILSLRRVIFINRERNQLKEPVV
jgi:O-antigen/teichoic acid export membrane protein